MDRTEQDALYEEARSSWGAALQRLARGYELDPERRRDLVQEMHIQLWRSLASFDRRCSLRTWVYRVSNNVGATHIVEQRRAARLLDLESLEPDMIIAINQADAQYCAGQSSRTDPSFETHRSPDHAALSGGRNCGIHCGGRRTLVVECRYKNSSHQKTAQNSNIWRE